MPETRYLGGGYTGGYTGGYSGLQKILEALRAGLPLPPTSAAPAFPGAPTPPGPVAPGPTKDSLEPSRGGVADTMRRAYPGGPPTGMARGMAPGAIPGVLSGIPPEPLPGLGHNAPPDESHIRYGLPGEALQDYVPGQPAFTADGFMGVTGPPGGGAFSPSQTDWSEVAGREEFPSYHEAEASSLRDLVRDAERARLMRSVEDPLWEERAKAQTWVDAQLRLQKGIRQAMQDQLETEIRRATEDIDRSMPNAAPEEKRRELEARIDAIQSRMFGARGSESSMRTPTGYGSEWTR